MNMSDIYWKVASITIVACGVGYFWWLWDSTQRSIEFNVEMLSMARDAYLKGEGFLPTTPATPVIFQDLPRIGDEEAVIDLVPSDEPAIAEAAEDPTL